MQLPLLSQLRQALTKLAFFDLHQPCGICSAALFNRPLRHHATERQRQTRTRTSNRQERERERERGRGRSTASAQRHRDRVPHTHRGACRHHTYVAACAAATPLGKHTPWDIALQRRTSSRRRACSHDRGQGRIQGSSICARRERERERSNESGHAAAPRRHGAASIFLLWGKPLLCHHPLQPNANPYARSLSSETMVRPHAPPQHF